MQTMFSQTVSTIANSVTRVQAPAVRARNQRPAATYEDRARTPLAAEEASARQLLATSWGWS